MIADILPASPPGAKDALDGGDAELTLRLLAVESRPVLSLLGTWESTECEQACVCYYFIRRHYTIKRGVMGKAKVVLLDL